MSCSRTILRRHDSIVDSICQKAPVLQRLKKCDGPQADGEQHMPASAVVLALIHGNTDHHWQETACPHPALSATRLAHSLPFSGRTIGAPQIEHYVVSSLWGLAVILTTVLLQVSGFVVGAMAGLRAHSAPPHRPTPGLSYCCPESLLLTKVWSANGLVSA